MKPLSRAKPCVFTSMVAPGVAKVGSVSLVSGPRSGKAVDKKCTRLSRELDLHFKMLKTKGVGIALDLCASYFCSDTASV